MSGPLVDHDLPVRDDEDEAADAVERELITLRATRQRLVDALTDIERMADDAVAWTAAVTTPHGFSPWRHEFERVRARASAALGGTRRAT